MITTNRRQLARVCQALLATCELKSYWTDDGPAAAAVSAQNGIIEISDAQRVVLQFAWTLWSGTEDLRMSDFVGQVGDESLVAVGTLFVASTYGQQGIADWLTMQNGSCLGLAPSADESPASDDDDPRLLH